MLKKNSRVPVIHFFPPRHPNACPEFLSKGEREGVRAQATSYADTRETRAYLILLSILTVVTVAVWFIIASATAVAAAASGGNDPAAATFGTNCSTCHSANGSGDTAVGKSIHIPDLRSPAVQSQPDAQLAEIITHGKGAMPPFGSSLSKDDIDALVKHIHGLAKTK